MRIVVGRVDTIPLSVDTAEDLEKVRAALAAEPKD
jgi:CMP-2-keto-3-deoxyoctulosonic acid synthetase